MLGKRGRGQGFEGKAGQLLGVTVASGFSKGSGIGLVGKSGTFFGTYLRPKPQPCVTIMCALAFALFVRLLVAELIATKNQAPAAQTHMWGLHGGFPKD